MIYAIGDAECNVKFGIAAHPQDRRDAMQTGNAKGLTVLGAIETDDDRGYEAELHQCLQRYRIRGEWFEPCLAVTTVVAAFPMGAQAVLQQAFDIGCYFDPTVSGLWVLKRHLPHDEAVRVWLGTPQGRERRAK